jgi:XapX domain-containing protein
VIAALVGLLLGFLIGVGCRWFDLPLPAPPRVVGALLVVFMTLGFLCADLALAQLGSGG